MTFWTFAKQEFQPHIYLKKIFVTDLNSFGPNFSKIKFCDAYKSNLGNDDANKSNHVCPKEFKNRDKKLFNAQMNFYGVKLKNFGSKKLFSDS